MAPPKHNFREDQSLAQEEEEEETPKDSSLWNKISSGAGALGTLMIKGMDAAQMEYVAGLPLKDSNAYMATGIKDLWAPMLHPPLTYRGGDFQYRSADGSNNNILYPELGKAGLPYAKSVPSKAGIHGARPDPGDLFDLLMARKDDTNSSSGISSMLLYHASVIIHDLFRTNAHDKDISDTSSYLDLSPLYGYDKDTQDTVRQKKKGLLKPDTFADKRLLLQPPGVCIYLVMYNRFHNYVAEQLLAINANGKFSMPVTEEMEGWKNLKEDEKIAMLAKQDEDLFQTARLITCGLYINISIHDYLRVLMRFHSFDTPFTLDPRIEIPLSKEKTGGKLDSRAEGTPRATGNMVSVEFNLLYRFHSAISTRDRIWSENFFKLFLKGRLGKDVTEEQILNGEVDVSTFKHVIDSMLVGTQEEKNEQLAKEIAAPCLPPGLETIGRSADGKPVYKFKRDPVTHNFSDAELVAEMVQVIEDPICQFGAQNIPKIFKAIEILGILQARKWEVATLNEFREFFGLKRHKTFEEINPDEGVHDALRNLYEHPDMVELYPGLLCEGQGRCLDPGSRGTALWSGVFCDAATLVRSDRFYTVDWNVASLTAWGMREVTSDPKVLKGSVFHRLFQRAFPEYFKYNSVHLWQPFVTPARNIILAREQKYLNLLSPTDFEWPKLLAKGVKNPEDPNFSWDQFAKLKYEDLEGNIHRKINRTAPVPVIEKPYSLAVISSYEDVKKILGNPSFQNPSILDTQMIPGRFLQDALTGKGGLDELTNAFENILTKDSMRHLLDYFDGMAKEITQRERRKFQILRLDSAYFNDQKNSLNQLNLDPRVEQEELKKIAEIERLALKNPKELTSEEKSKLLNVQQTYQLDVVKDYAIPIITRFFVDFLGFWDKVKTPSFDQREFDENQIDTHIRNCQDYIAYNSDETKQWQRRMAFKKSIEFLKGQAEYGVKQSMKNRTAKLAGDEDYVIKIRQLGFNVSAELKKMFKGQPEKDQTEKVAAIMLKAAMDVSQRSVLTFTRVLSIFIDDAPGKSPYRKEWIDIQNCAYSESPQAIAKLQRYVLEAQRLTVQLPVIRKYQPSKPEDTISFKVSDKEVKLRSGDKILLDLKTAQQDPKVFPRPETFSMFPSERELDKYLSPGKPNSEEDGFQIQALALLGLAGMLKHIAKLKDVRVAHDTLGRLKRVKTQNSLEGFMTITWDQVVPFPTTWSIRYNGEGRGVYTGKDNANQGHGSNQVYQKPFLATYERNLAKVKNLEDRIQNLEKEIGKCRDEKKKLAAVLNGDL